MSPTQTVKHLTDYRPLAHRIHKVQLTFTLSPTATIVEAELHIVPLPNAPQSLTLDGSATLLALSLNGETQLETAYTQTAESLTLHRVPAEPFVLHITTQINPEANQTLNGLYASGGNLYTQCEPEGFRTMTYYLDRPDNMAVFTTKIIADAAQYPVLLSNGNLVDSGSLKNGQHYAVWHDPFAKPSYLFALVAGDLAVNRSSFTTQSGREVAIQFYTHAEDAHKVAHAMQSLKHAMRWDETRFGLEYDLDVFMVVAVGDFNMGAMENKGLNIFNTKYVLADAHTATDADFEGVESVIGHEYFHNWTGNRVTCRDWFQLSLKEGLTVFRDQEFSGDRASRAVRRIENVQTLRQFQFAEDASPMAHPVRPASYVEMNNFYTATVYEKGAEVVRMYHTLLGEAGFQRGMKLYFARHDGQAVTCDDFRAAMADANGVNLDQFALWYSQAGTPTLDVSSSLKTNGDYVLHIKQTLPDTPDMPTHAKQPMMIPIKIALLNEHGEQIAFRQPENGCNELPPSQTETVLVLTQAEQTFTLQPEAPAQAITPSLLRGFSAPVHLNFDYTDPQLALLLAHDTDPYARWEAAQTLYRRAIAANETALLSGSPLPEHHALLQAIDYVLRADISAAFQATLLAIPNEAELWAGRQNIDPLIVHRAREALLDLIAAHFADQFAVLNAEARRMEEEQSGLAKPYEYHPQQAGWRALRNACRAFILRARPEHIEQVAANYSQMAHNMTHEWGILSAINHNERPERNRLLEQFAAKFHSDDLVMCKYFSLIAASHRADTPAQVATALEHPAFSLENPNKARALLGSFSRNVPHFHAKDGSGYAFLAGQIGRIDRFNPQIAARLAQAFNICAQIEPQRRSLMRSELQKLAENPALSKDSGEIIGKILQASE